MSQDDSMDGTSRRRMDAAAAKAWLSRANARRSAARSYRSLDAGAQSMLPTTSRRGGRYSRQCIPRVVSLCERQTFTADEGGGEQILARFVDVADAGDAVLEVLLHDQDFQGAGGLTLEIFPASMAQLPVPRGDAARRGNDDLDQIFVAANAATSVSFDATSQVGTLHLGQITSPYLGEGLQARLMIAPGVVAPTGGATITARLVLRGAPPAQAIMTGDVTVLGALAVGDVATAGELALRSASGEASTLAWQTATASSDTTRWSLAHATSGALAVERFDSSGVSVDTPLSISSSDGLVSGKMLHTTLSACDLTNANKNYFNFTGTGFDTTLSTTTQNARWIAPGAGRLREVRVICLSNAGSTKICFHLNNDTSSNSTREVTATLSATTSTTFSFSGKSTSFSAGDRLSVSIDPTNAPDETTVICIWELTI